MKRIGANPDHASAPPSEGTTAGMKKWTVGTLTYTSASLAVLFCWLLFGDFALSMRERSVLPMAQWYLSQLNVPGILFGLLVSSFPAAVGLVLGPIISVKSDRHRGRWGRRIPFLLATTPPAALGMVGLGLTPSLARWLQSSFPGQSETVVALVCFAVFWAAFEVASIAGTAVIGGLINDVVPGPLLGRFHGLFRAVSLIGGMVFNYWIMGRTPDHFASILIVLGAFYGVCFMWMCFKVKEGAYPPPPAKTESCEGRGAAMRAYFKESFSNRYYLAVFVMLMAASLTIATVNLFAIPYARSLGVDMDLFGKSLALTFLISLCLSYPLGWLADRLHPLRTAMASLAGYVAVTVWGALFATTPTTFLIAWVLHGVLSGTYLTCSASLGQRLFPREKYAQFTSAAAMTLAPANMLLAPGVGLFIDWTGKTYRHSFTVAALLGLTGLMAAWHVHRRFMKLGGPKGYVPPEVW